MKIFLSFLFALFKHFFDGYLFLGGRNRLESWYCVKCIRGERGWLVIIRTGNKSLSWRRSINKNTLHQQQAELLYLFGVKDVVNHRKCDSCWNYISDFSSGEVNAGRDFFFNRKRNDGVMMTMHWIIIKKNPLFFPWSTFFDWKRTLPNFPPGYWRCSDLLRSVGRFQRTKKKWFRS